MIEKSKQRLTAWLPVLCCMICMTVTSAFWLQVYRLTTFEHISQFCQVLISEHPDAQEQVLAALKRYHSYTEQEIAGKHFLEQYGYRSGDFCGEMPYRILIFFAVAFLLVIGVYGISFWYRSKCVRLRVSELTNYLEQVNVGASGTLMQAKEDGFSHLQDEIYKTVTGLYQTREAAVQAKTNFADNLANIAHQIKTPITAMLLSLQLMKQKTPNVYIGQMEKQLERLDRLEEALLTLSRIDAGTLHMEESQVDVYTALNLASENLSDLLLKGDISVEIPDKGCVQIRGDLEWTMEAFINLMKNCMEHSEAGGCIHCDYSQNPLYVEVLIWDEGQGFEAEDIPHLFERFYRGKSVSGNGIGIGLALAWSIFELQNGTITARNLPGGGACFEIRVYSH